VPAAGLSGILRAVDVSPDLVRKTAALARLALGDDEVARASRDLTRILAHVEALGAASPAAASGPAGAAAAIPSAALRADVPTASLSREDALANAPAHDEVFFLVPKVLDGD
jgi:aspartyl-tRNA(Asn)/glutamyl-tRNA(Gln) amidotransferase subunit C